MKEKQFAVLGLGRFGEALAITLSELGCNVVVVDKDEEKIQNIADSVTYAVQADVTDINALKSIGLKNVDAIVVSITSDINSSIMGIVNAQELGIKEIYGKANTAQHEKVLLKLGVKKVFSPERDMGERVAHNLFSGDSIDILELALVISKRYGFQLRSDNEDNTRIFVSLRTLAAHIASSRTK